MNPTKKGNICNKVNNRYHDLPKSPYFTEISLEFTEISPVYGIIPQK
jgi:hypothetical protein